MRKLRNLLSNRVLVVLTILAIVIGGMMFIYDQKSPPSEEANMPDGRQGKVDVSQILSGGPGKDGIPSIDSPKFWDVEEANKFLKDDDVVLGLEFEGESRAYPLRILNWHEIVNDEIAGEPILITYCPLCYTGIAFKSEINGVPTEFGVSGKLYNNNLLMYNRTNDQIKDESLWSQQLGEAVTGSLTGTKLEQIVIDTLIWNDWKDKHPDTKVLSTDTGHFRNYDVNPYGNYEFNDREIIFPVTSADDRLPAKAKIYGIEINGKFKAYPQDELKKGSTITDQLAGESIKITVDDAGRVRMESSKGEEIDWQISFWFSWAAFHPETEIY